MRLNRGLLGWGVFFIVLGAVPLAVRQGVLDQDDLRGAWQLWPLILIGIGLSLALVRTRLALLGGLLVATTFGLMGGALLATGVELADDVNACGFGPGERGQPFESRSGSFRADGSARLEMNCGEVLVTAADGAGWSVAGTSEDGRSPEIDAGDGRLVVRAPDQRGVNIGGSASRWAVELPRQGTVAVDLSVNAGSGDLDLAGMTVPGLNASVNAGDARIDLSGARGTERVEASVNAGSLVLLLPVPAGTVRGSLSVNAGSANVCAPDGAAIRFRGGDQALGSTNFTDRGLVQAGDTWSTPGYDEAPARIDLAVNVNLGSITLDPEDGCD